MAISADENVLSGKNHNPINDGGRGFLPSTEVNYLRCVLFLQKPDLLLSMARINDEVYTGVASQQITERRLSIFLNSFMPRQQAEE